MIPHLKLRFFAHSWRSDWNHGNAHFLRGLTYELSRLGNEVRCYESEESWSFTNLLREPDAANSLEQFHATFPNLDVRLYAPAHFAQFAENELKDADVVVVHEWNSPHVANVILSLRNRFGYRVLFHDTHHRAYSTPAEIAKFPITEFDGVLAFGEAIRRIYSDILRARRAWTFHEAADTAHFYPIASTCSTGVNWIGNWGDEERTRELHEFLIHPLQALRSDAVVYGVLYPLDARQILQASGIRYGGYLPNLAAPKVHSRSALTLHIPRRYYANGLSGIPTIRMFEAMACGIPLICSPWSDTENLFRPGQDYICVSDGSAMQSEVSRLLHDESASRQLAENGLQTIRQRHTCAHRAQEFLNICEELGR
jgi:spore maturation protein CgeB